TGHAYGGIMSARKAEFAAHPEYKGLINGERKSSKFCISNPGLRQIVADYALEYFEKRPEATMISMDPTDGGGWCECEQCAKIGNGSPSDRAVFLANTVAEAINQKF